MARQFLIGEIGSTTYTSGKLADTALNIEALSVADDEGPISWAIGDAVPDMIRFVQGTTSGPNVYSNWINPRNIIVADGSPTDGPVHCEVDLVLTGTSADVSAANNNVIELKFVWKNPNGVDEFYHLDVDLTTNGQANTVVDAVIQTAYEAATDKPNWLHTDCSTSGDVAAGATGADTPSTPADGTVTFMGNVSGATTTDSGEEFDAPDAAQIEVIVVTDNDTTGLTYAPAVIVAPSNEPVALVVNC